VVYRKSNRYAEKRAGQKLNFLIIFLIFFEFFEIGLTAKRVNRMCNFSLPSSCKNFSQNGEPSEKLCLFYGRYLKLCFFFEGTTRQIDQQRLGHNFSLVCAMGNRQMDPRGGCGARRKAQGGSQPI